MRSIFWNKAPKKTLIQVLPAKLLLIVGGSWHSQHQLSSCTSSKLPANHYHLFFWSSLCSEKEANFAQRDSDFIFIFSQVWVVTRGTVTMDTITSKHRELTRWSRNDRNSGMWWTCTHRVYDHHVAHLGLTRNVLCALEKQISKSSGKGLLHTSGRFNCASDMFPLQTPLKL